MRVSKTSLTVVLAIMLAGSAIAASGTAPAPQDLQQGRPYRPLEGYWDSDVTQPGDERYFVYDGHEGGGHDKYIVQLVTMPDRSGQRTMVKRIGTAVQGITPYGRQGYYEYLWNSAANTNYPNAGRTLILEGDSLTIYECLPVWKGCPHQIWTRVDAN